MQLIQRLFTLEIVKKNITDRDKMQKPAAISMGCLNNLMAANKKKKVGLTITFLLSGAYELVSFSLSEFYAETQVFFRGLTE